MSSESEVELSGVQSGEGGDQYEEVLESEEQDPGTNRSSLLGQLLGEEDEEPVEEDGEAEKDEAGGGDSAVGDAEEKVEKKKSCFKFGSEEEAGDAILSNYGISKGDEKRNKRMVKKHPMQGKYRGTVDSVGGRHCTDSLCLIMLVLCWAAMSVIGYTAYQNGEPYRLLGPIDSLGRVCGYDEDVIDLPKFYTISEYGFGTCIAECFTKEEQALTTSVDPDDYICLPLDAGSSAYTFGSSLYIQNLCMDTWPYVAGVSVYDSSKNCGCNLIYETEEFFRRCRFADPLVSANYITQSKPDFLNAFIADVLKASEVIFSFGFVCAIALSFILIRLFHYEAIGSLLIWSCICGVVALMIAMLLLAQRTVVEWENEDPAVHSADSIMALKIFSAVLAGIAFLYSCMIVFLRKRINTAIKAISLAARAVDAMPIIVTTPMIQVGGFALFVIPLVFYSFYLATDGYFENIYQTVPWTSVKVMVGKEYHLNDGVVSKLWFLFFCLLWTMNFLVAIGSLVVALAVSKWYFTMPNRRWRDISGWTVLGSYFKAIRFHAGTAAFGGLLVSLIQFAKAMVAYIERNLPKKTKDRLVVKFIFCLLQCFLSCLERCMKFISKHSYIQTAIHSTSFMFSAKNAFFTMARNIFLIGVVAAISDMGILVGKVFVCLLSTAASYYWLNNYYQDQLYDFVAPTMLVLLISWITVTMFMDVFSIAIDTIIMCYITDLEQNGGKFAAFVDKNTSFFIISHQKHEDLNRKFAISAQSAYRRGSLDTKSQKEVKEFLDKAASSTKRKSINLSNNSTAAGAIISSTTTVSGEDGGESSPQLEQDSNEISISGSFSEEFPLDAGRKGYLPHLSTAKALQQSFINRPMGKVGKQYTQYPLTQYFGRFKGPIETFFSGDHSKEKYTILTKYGSGVAFYFRMLKTLGITFTVMSLITFPTLVIFSMANNISTEELTMTAMASSEQMLALSTIAAFAEPVATCRDTPDMQTFAFTCPAPYTITSIVAYFGQNHGYCACPRPNQPSSNGDCKAPILDSSYPGLCGVDPDTGLKASCFPFTDRYKNDCCSFNSNVYGNTDTTFYNLHTNSSCNSVTAPFIAYAECEGKQRCRFAVNSTAEYKYSFPATMITSKLKDISDNIQSPKSYICETLEDDTCTTSLEFNSDFSSCDPLFSKSLIFEAVCMNSDVLVGDVTLDPAVAVEWASYLDALAIMIYISTVYWMRYTISQEEKEENKSSCTASDYTIMCKTLPKLELPSDASDIDRINAGDTMKVKLQEFFETKISEACIETGQVLSEPIKVADINFATAYTDYISSAIIRGESSFQIDVLILKIYSQLQRKVFDETRHEGMVLMRALTKALLRFEIAHEICTKLSPIAQSTPYAAYITFANETSYIQCLKTFPNIGWLTRFVQNKKYKMDGHRVKLKRAEDPTEIIWENIAVPWWNRLIRIIFTSFASLIILTISYAIIYQAKYSSSKFMSKAKVQSCSTFNVILDEDATWNTTSNDITYQKVIWDQNPDYYHTLYPNDNFTTYGSMGYASCYCQSVLSNLYDGDLEKMREFTFYDPVKIPHEQMYCDESFGKSVTNSVAAYLATLVIVIINISMQYFMRFAVDFERHGNRTAEVVSLAIKLFVLQFINTGILTLIISGNLSKIHVENLRFGTAGIVEFGIFTGDIKDFDKSWYFNVGSSIMFTMFTFVFSSMPYQIYRILYVNFRRIYDRRWDFTPKITHLDLQKELDDLYLGPEPAFEMKYAALISLIFVDLTYSAAMPLLYPITAMNIGLIYMLEKYLFLRVTKSPTVLNADLPRKTTLILLVAAGLHACMGLWMFSNSQFYEPYIEETQEWIQNAATNTWFLEQTHSWEPPVDWDERLYGKHSWHLFLISLGIGGLIAVQLVHLLIFEVFGMRPLVNNFFYFLRKKFKCLESVNLPIVEFVPEGNRPYFESIKLDALILRHGLGLLQENIHHQYGEEIERKKELQKEEDREIRAILKEKEKQMEEMMEEVDRANQVMRGDSDRPALEELEKEQKAVKTAVTTPSGYGDDDEVEKEDDFNTNDDTIEPKTDDFEDDNNAAGLRMNKTNDVNVGKGNGNDQEQSRMLYKSLTRSASEFTISQQNRDMIGHESYNISTMPAYINAFGLESTHFTRRRPRDWLVSHAKLKPAPNDSEELQKILADCAPRRDKDGNISWYDRHFMT